MFDTIVLRLHNATKYQKITKALFDPNSGTRRFHIELDELHEIKYKAAKSKRAFTDYLDTKNLYEHDYRKKIKLSQSSNYSFQYKHNTDRNFLEFEFSIPKFLYGTNVIQALYHATDIPNAPKLGTFNKYQWCQKDNDFLKVGGNMDYGYDFLIKFLKNQFFGYLFPFVYINFEDVQIKRLDVCFNQVFASKEHALEYLSYQKLIKKKYTRDSGSYVRDWKTAVFYKGETHSAKIYHKGTEFAKNDSKELRKININLKKEKKDPIYDVAVLQDLADKTLRYEITAHNVYFSYLHMQHIFRKDMPQFKEMRKKYNNIRGRITKMARKGKFDPKEVTPIERAYYKDVVKIMNKRYDFRVKASEYIKHYHTSFNSYNTINEAHFSPTLCYLLMKRLKQFFDEFQVTERPEETGVIKALQGYNETIRAKGLTIRKDLKLNDFLGSNKIDMLPDEEIKAKKKEHIKRGLDLAPMRGFLSHLNSYGSYAELVNSKIYERRYIDRMAERFKKIGYDIKSPVAPVSHMTIQRDFAPYHKFLLYNANTLAGHFKFFS